MFRKLYHSHTLWFVYCIFPHRFLALFLEQFEFVNLLSVTGGNKTPFSNLKRSKSQLIGKAETERLPTNSFTQASQGQRKTADF